MLDVLLEKVGYDGRSSLLRTVGFIHSGLFSCICYQIVKEVLDTVLSNKKQNQNDTSRVKSCLVRPPLPSTPSSLPSSSIQ